MLSDKLASKHHLILTPTKASVIHKLFLQLIGKLHVILHQLYTYRSWNFILKLQDCNHDILHMGERPWNVFHKGWCGVVLKWNSITHMRSSRVSCKMHILCLGGAIVPISRNMKGSSIFYMNLKVSARLTSTIKGIRLNDLDGIPRWNEPKGCELLLSTQWLYTSAETYRVTL
jgi:hypothetical protein